MVFTIGQALKITKGLVVTTDINIPRDRSVYPCFGIEWRVPMRQSISAALRAGYDGRLNGYDSGSLTGLTFGGGLGLQRFGFDYGWSPAGFLGSTHKMSLSYRF